jgi:hypothetical protein
VAVFSYLAGSTSDRPLLKSYPPRPENLLVLRFIGIFSPEKEELKTGRERLNDEKIHNFLLLSGIFSLLPSVRFFYIVNVIISCMMRCVGKVRVKVKVKLFLCFTLTGHHAMKAYWGMEV